MEAGRTIQELEETLVHPERQLSLLFRVHNRQGAPGYHSPGEHQGDTRTFRELLSLFVIYRSEKLLTGANRIALSFSVPEMR